MYPLRSSVQLGFALIACILLIFTFCTAVFVSFCCFFVIEMVDMKGQHVCIKFCCKSGKSVAKTHLMLKQAFGDYALG